MRFYRQSAVSKRTLRDILSKEYSEDDRDAIITEIFEMDPDKKGHKNSVWLAKQYLITDGNLPENLTKLLEVFNILCDRNRIKDKELKNYKSIEDLRDIVERESAKGLSKKDELEKRKKEGLKEIDRLGEFVLYHATDYDVWKSRIKEKMKEGYECGWCIKDPEYWNDYSKDGYFYVEKDGQPWIVADNNSGQCKDYQYEANPDNIKQCAYLLYKNGMDFSNSFKPIYLFQDENVPEKIENEILEKAIENPDNAYYLLSDKIVTKGAGEVFNKVVEKVIEKPYNAAALLLNEVITKSDGEVYNKVLGKVIENSDNAKLLLTRKLITEGDGEIFEKALEKAIEKSSNAYSLLCYKTIAKSDVSSELWEKLLASAEKYKPDVRQKFAGRGYILGKSHRKSRSFRQR